MKVCPDTNGKRGKSPHQYFMVKKGLFVLVWRVIPKISCNLYPFKDEVYAMVIEWLETVQLRVPGARILIVATHIDCAHESEVDRQCKRAKALIHDKVEELKEDELLSGIPAPIVWKHGDSLRVNCLDGTGVEALRLQLIMAHDLPWWQEGIPGGHFTHTHRKSRCIQMCGDLNTWQHFRWL